MEELVIYQSDVIPAEDFGHGFPERTGGVSTGKRGSLNLGTKWGDDPKLVEENLRRVAAAADYQQNKFIGTKHIHGVDVWVVGQDEPSAYDGVVTNETGVTLAAFAADCIPMVFADPVARVCGAAHAGWRGTLARMGQHMVEAMGQLGSRPGDIFVALGPSINVDSFEVGQEVASKFDEEFGQASGVVVDGPSKEHVDLHLAARICLEDAGIVPDNIDASPPDTLSNPERFFSYRRDGESSGVHMGFVFIR